MQATAPISLHNDEAAPSPTQHRRQRLNSLLSTVENQASHCPTVTTSVESLNIVPLLIQNRADVNAQGGLYRHPF